MALSDKQFLAYINLKGMTNSKNILPTRTMWLLHSFALEFIATYDNNSKYAEIKENEEFAAAYNTTAKIGGVLVSILGKIISIACQNASKNKNGKINTFHILSAVYNDDELTSLPYFYNLKCLKLIQENLLYC